MCIRAGPRGGGQPQRPSEGTAAVVAAGAFGGLLGLPAALGLPVLDGVDGVGDVLVLGGLLGELRLHLGVERLVVARRLGDAALVRIDLALEVVDLLLLRLLLGLQVAHLLGELLGEGADLLDGRGLLLGDLVEVVDAVGEVLGGGGAEDEVEQPLAAGLVGALHALAEGCLLLGELLAGGLDLRLGLGDGVVGGLELGRCGGEALLVAGELGAEGVELGRGCGEVGCGVGVGHGCGKRRQRDGPAEGERDARGDRPVSKLHERESFRRPTSTS